ncbi:MAG: hypothetical protein R2771_15770 [Saprospiraceae bacterium]
MGKWTDDCPTIFMNPITSFPHTANCDLTGYVDEGNVTTTFSNPVTGFYAFTVNTTGIMFLQ